MNGIILLETLNDLLNRLQQSFEIQRRFISSASHELSTPLTSISSQLEVSLQRNREAKEYRGCNAISLPGCTKFKQAYTNIYWSLQQYPELKEALKLIQ